VGEAAEVPAGLAAAPVRGIVLALRGSRFTKPPPPLPPDAREAGREPPGAGGASFGQLNDENEGSFLIGGIIPGIDVPGRVLDVPGRDLCELDFSGDGERGRWSSSHSLRSLSQSRTENVVPSRINDRAILCSRLQPPKLTILCFLDNTLSLPPCCGGPGGGGGGTTDANLFLFLFSTA